MTRHVLAYAIVTSLFVSIIPHSSFANSAVSANSIVSNSDYELKFNGRVFVNLTNLETTSGGVTDNQTNIDVKRFYLTFTKKFKSGLYANFTPDITYRSNTDNTALAIKTAYIGKKYSGNHDIKVGSALMPWSELVTAAQGYRYVEMDINDLHGITTSADWGVHLSGPINKYFNYRASIVNGAGYKNWDTGNSPDLETLITGKYKNLTVAVGHQIGKVGNDKLRLSDNTYVKYKTSQRYNILMLYKIPNATLGGEYFKAINRKTTMNKPHDYIDGYSFFGDYKFNKVHSVFARINKLKPNRVTRPDYEITSKIFGVEHKFTPKIALSLAYKLVKTNYALTTKPKEKSQEYGLWLEYKF